MNEEQRAELASLAGALNHLTAQVVEMREEMRKLAAIPPQCAERSSSYLLRDSGRVPVSSRCREPAGHLGGHSMMPLPGEPIWGEGRATP